jgi:2-iminobutanoate/2-iminopropanoate deaminase
VKKQVIRTLSAPAAIGPYSQAIRAGGLLYVSGQIPIDPATGVLIPGSDIQSQTRRVLLNLEEILLAGGATKAGVLKVTVFLADMKDFSEMNAVYAEFFGSSVAAPARSTVEVSRLPRDARVEIDCNAVVE